MHSSCDHIALARRLIDEGRPVCEVAKILKVHRATLYRALVSSADESLRVLC